MQPTKNFKHLKYLKKKHEQNMIMKFSSFVKSIQFERNEEMNACSEEH